MITVNECKSKNDIKPTLKIISPFKLIIKLFSLNEEDS